MHLLEALQTVEVPVILVIDRFLPVDESRPRPVVAWDEESGDLAAEFGRLVAACNRFDPILVTSHPHGLVRWKTGQEARSPITWHQRGVDSTRRALLVRLEKGGSLGLYGPTSDAAEAKPWSDPLSRLATAFEQPDQGVILVTGPAAFLPEGPFDAGGPLLRWAVWHSARSVWGGATEVPVLPRHSLRCACPVHRGLGMQPSWYGEPLGQAIGTVEELQEALHDPDAGLHRWRDVEASDLLPDARDTVLPSTLRLLVERFDRGVPYHLFLAHNLAWDWCLTTSWSSFHERASFSACQVQNLHHADWLIRRRTLQLGQRIDDVGALADNPPRLLKLFGSASDPVEALPAGAFEMYDGDDPAGGPRWDRAGQSWDDLIRRGLEEHETLWLVVVGASQQGFVAKRLGDMGAGDRKRVRVLWVHPEPLDPNIRGPLFSRMATCTSQRKRPHVHLQGSGLDFFFDLWRQRVSNGKRWDSSTSLPDSTDPDPTAPGDVPKRLEALLQRLFVDSPDLMRFVADLDISEQERHKLLAALPPADRTSVADYAFAVVEALRVRGLKGRVYRRLRRERPKRRAWIDGVARRDP
ncbi:MAG: hypothetical protein KTR31_01090 [Myxococcales bacterium]|nr:hypothetical protein [Myxococcales bacterium]